MKLLFDENLSPRLPQVLAGLFPESLHVHDCGLGRGDDSAIWGYAKEHGLTIVSKDSDFQERSVLFGHPPKVIWLRAANCTTSQIEHLLRTAFPLIKKFVEQDDESCLILGTRVGHEPQK